MCSVEIETVYCIFSVNISISIVLRPLIYFLLGYFIFIEREYKNFSYQYIHISFMVYV